MTPFEQAFEHVNQLSEKFQNNYSYYSSPSYQEAEARKDFIDKFFIALGWDVNHDAQHNPYEQEVKVEKGQRQQQATAQKRADYAFYAAPNFKDVRFFAEAKKPAVGLRHHDHYFQTIRYGWNANTPLAVLTDFEEFHIIDCRYQPDLNTVFKGNHREYRYTDYSDKEKFAEIYWLFSREAVTNNSLKKFSEGLPKLKGKKASPLGGGLVGAAIDDSFLVYIEGIREELAKAFKKNDESLGSEALTEVVTRTVDRLVFIRFLEDKLIEQTNHVSEWRSWNDFITDCRRMDAKYNGVVFKEHPLLDKKSFAGAEEKMFLHICKDISNLNSPYDFNYIPIHILGSIYEQFLGKVVVATEHRVRIEDKPEVRKAGGVYYTPRYIVDYIVKNTVWECIKDKTPKEIATLRFADIACGSGSFLIGVYEYLLDYHKKYYQKKYEGHSDTLHKNNEDYGNVEYKDGQWLLTLKLKQDILLNNIYGVDIDRQAVEVTQLSLFLKMLEDETLSSTQVRQGALFSKVLPDLSKNIVCGNSLIGTDILQQGLFSFPLKGEGRDGGFSFEEEKKLNPMDFETAFPAIMKNGGFDAIVGNPPYVRQELLGDSKNYFKKYKVYQGTADLYSYFIERGISLLNEKGLYGVIVANKWMRTNYGYELRKWLKEQTIKELVDFGDLPVFKEATTYPCILIAARGKNFNTSFKGANVLTLEFDDLSDYVEVKKQLFKTDELEDNNWNLTSRENTLLFKKLQSNNISLEDYANKKIYRGIITGLNEAFVIDESTRQKLVKEDINSDRLIKPFLAGKDIKRYETNIKSSYLILIPRGFTNKEGNKPKNAWAWFENNFPAIAKHLLEFEEAANVRYDKGDFWWELRACDYYNEFEKAKIIYPNICKQPEFTYDVSNFYTNQKCYIISLDDKYLLGVLNSKLSNFLFEMMLPKLRGGFYEPNYVVFKNYPIKKLDLNNKENKLLHDQLVTFVTQMLEAKKQLANTQTEGDKDFLENKCSSLDRQIDKLVYQLYELKEEEIKIVEG